MGRILNHLDQGTEIALVSVSGGSQDNVIAGTAEAVIAVADPKKAQEIVSDMEATLKAGVFL